MLFFGLVVRLQDMGILEKILKSNKTLLLPIIERVQVASILAASREQKLSDLMIRLRDIVPDVSSQNTTYAIDSRALELRVRLLHAFQVRLALKAIDLVLSSSGDGVVAPFTIVDVGDSAGTHLLYLRGLLKEDPRFPKGFTSVSVNLDPVAVEKIRGKGLRAELCRAEKLHERDIRASLFMSFETIEHLSDPISFLNAMSRESKCPFLVLTVPYRAYSRVGMQYIRNGQQSPTTSENTHIFELCPEDWKLIFKHSGWNVLQEDICWQYPRRSLLLITKPIWRRFDFEGFYGVILGRNRAWADLYKG